MNPSFEQMIITVFPPNVPGGRFDKRPDWKVRDAHYGARLGNFWGDCGAKPLIQRQICAPIAFYGDAVVDRTTISWPRREPSRDIPNSPQTKHSKHDADIVVGILFETKRRRNAGNGAPHLAWAPPAGVMQFRREWTPSSAEAGLRSERDASCEPAPMIGETPGLDQHNCAVEGKI
jgi:hypothetical protein